MSGDTPDTWGIGAVNIGDHNYVLISVTGGTVMWWHPCGSNPWYARPLDTHTIESINPLSVKESVLCQDCGYHGYIREGRWVPA